MEVKTGKKYWEADNSALILPLEGFCVIYFQKERRVIKHVLFTEAPCTADLIILK